MLKGSREGILAKIQPISIHGQISLDVQFVYPDDPNGQIQVARTRSRGGGKRTRARRSHPVDFLVGVATGVKRVKS